MPYSPVQKEDQGTPLYASERVLDSIPGLLVWVAFVVALVGAIYYPQHLLYLATVLAVYTAIRFLYAGIANLRGFQQIAEWEQRDWLQYYQKHKDAQSLNRDEIQHLVIIPNYSEPIAVLRRTLNCLKTQHNARKQISVVLAMEAHEADHQAKAQALVDEFYNDFKHLFFTVHPAHIKGEMACKSANEAWAARWAKHKLVDELGHSLDHILVTTMDADTRWHPQYFSALTTLFALNRDRHLRFWQGAIRYHGNIWEINPLLRMVNAYATAFELAYLSVDWWLALPISSYSLSLRLLHESDYWDGDVIADEWHMFIKAYFVHDGQIQVEKVMLPFIADATTSNSFLGEVKERYLQTLRHAWGSKEISYMLANISHRGAIPLKPILRRLMRVSHDILMAGAGWVILTIGSQLPVLLHPEIAPFTPIDIMQNPQQAQQIIIEGFLGKPVWIVLSISVTLVILLAVVFWSQDVRVRPERNQPATLIERCLTILSFPLMPAITLIVLAIPAIDAQTRLLLGIPLNFRVSKKAHH